MWRQAQVVQLRQEGNAARLAEAVDDKTDIIYFVDPNNPLHVIDANDGGGAITYNVSSRQRTWSDQDFPTAQFYHVITTAHLPFHVCGSQQDNSSLCVPSNTNAGGSYVEHGSELYVVRGLGLTSLPAFVFILQQQWEIKEGDAPPRFEWRDVPIVSEEEAKKE